MVGLVSDFIKELEVPLLSESLREPGVVSEPPDVLVEPRDGLHLLLLQRPAPDVQVLRHPGDHTRPCPAPSPCPCPWFLFLVLGP